jgi:hypothetical protein
MARARFHKTFFMPSLEGQFKLWKNELSTINPKVDEIIQLGNIIGCSPLTKDKETRGPNEALLNFIGLWRSTYSNWTQIIGPNEILALNFPDEWTNMTSNRILRKRWLEGELGRFQVASVSKGRLVTHGGLTYGLWCELGRPTDVHEVARLLNERYAGSLYQGPCYRLGNGPNFAANPIFAHPYRELYPSWITSQEPMPFKQIHGSLGLNSVDGRAALQDSFTSLEYLEKVSYTFYGSVVTVRGGKTFLNVAPEFPVDKLVSYVPSPWRLYIEKIPVVDLRDELFVKRVKTGTDN